MLSAEHSERHTPWYASGRYECLLARRRGNERGIRGIRNLIEMGEVRTGVTEDD